MNSIKLEKKWVDKLIDLPETGMGYQHVKISLSDGKVVESTVINCENLLALDDFPLDKIIDIEVVEGWGAQIK